MIRVGAVAFACVAHDVVRCVSLKLSQGAKPGIGGVLPGSKVNAEIAGVRDVPIGRTVISPPYHRVFRTPRELVLFVARMRELAGGKPTGVKLCLGSRHGRGAARVRRPHRHTAGRGPDHGAQRARGHGPASEDPAGRQRKGRHRRRRGQAARPGRRLHERGTRHDVRSRQIMASMGVSEPAALKPHMLRRRVSPTVVRSYAELYPFIDEGQLLADPPEDWLADWSLADPDRFTT